MEKKKRHVKGGRRRLKKKCQFFEFDDEMVFFEIDNKNSSPVASIRNINKSEMQERKSRKKQQTKRQKTMMMSLWILRFSIQMMLLMHTL